MEHFLLPEGAPLRGELVVYEGRSDYIGVDFSEYAKQRGHGDLLDFPDASVEPSLLSINKSRESGEALLRDFLHTWLFSSLLQEFFTTVADVDATYRHGDFIVAVDDTNECHSTTTKTVFCTSNLSNYLLEWRKSARSLSVESATYVHSKLSKCLDIVDYTLRVARHMCSLASRRVIAATAEELQSTMYSAFASEPFEFEIKSRAWAYFGWTLQDVKRMVSNHEHDFVFSDMWTHTYLLKIDLGWCPLEANSIHQHDTYMRNLLYVSNLPRKYASADHTACAQETKCAASKIDGKPRHCSSCKHVDCVEMFALDNTLMIRAIQILEANELPVLSLSEKDGNRELIIELKPLQNSIPYIAISHVWSDGLGNQEESVLPLCQWRHLYQVSLEAWRFENEANSAPVNIWIDTICCPVGPGSAKKKVLSRMREIYAGAQTVLVLDAELSRISAQNLEELEVWTRVLYSRWMTRLWTLQELFLAKNVLIDFADTLVNLDKLYSNLLQNHNPVAHNWLRRYCGLRSHLLSNIESGFRDPLFGLCHSLRTRSVTLQSDEPLCLATLLTLDSKSIVEAREDRRMAQFWKVLTQSHVSISKNIIFLKTPKLDTKSLKWAPATLLATGPDASYAITKEGSLASLDLEGLRFASLGLRIGRSRPDGLLVGYWKLSHDWVKREFAREICLMRTSRGVWSKVICSSDLSPGQILAFQTYSSLEEEVDYNEEGKENVLGIISQEVEADYAAISARYDSLLVTKWGENKLLKVSKQKENIIYGSLIRNLNISTFLCQEDMQIVCEFALNTVKAFKMSNASFKLYEQEKASIEEFLLEYDSISSENGLYSESGPRTDVDVAMPYNRHLQLEGKAGRVATRLSILDALREELSIYTKEALKYNVHIKDIIDKRNSSPDANSVWFSTIAEDMLANNFHIDVELCASTQEWVVD